MDKKAYIFGGSSGSGFGGQHNESTSDPVYLNDLFVLKGKSYAYTKHVMETGGVLGVSGLTPKSTKKY